MTASETIPEQQQSFFPPASIDESHELRRLDAQARLIHVMSHAAQCAHARAKGNLEHAVEPERQTLELANQPNSMQLRDALTDRLQELRAEVHSAKQTQREWTSASAHEVTDRKDDATQQQSPNLGCVQEQRDVDDMARVEAAPQRLAGGTYGDCADYAKPISLQRLRVQPAALRCAPCRAAREHAVDR
ncbi:MAG: TraR/DksA C4-type zinc finger protein [Rubrivivax sp.]|nr:TraR/DksA C4-type zinc finger protein [Rubrivivax sp.]